MIRSSAKLLGGPTAQRVREMQATSPLGELLDEVEEDLPELTVDQWATEAAAEFGAMPWNDAGPDRVIRWSALGIEWEVRSVNSLQHARAAERFAAAAQILVAELAADDLILLPIRIRVQVRAAATNRVRRQDNNDTSDWLLDLTAGGEHGELLDPSSATRELVVSLGAVMHDACLLSSSQLMAAIERCFEAGLHHKIGAGRGYDEPASQLIDSGDFAALERGNLLVPAAWRVPVRPDPQEALAARTGPGPRYDRGKHEGVIRRRYENSLQVLCFTVPGLANDASFLDMYAALTERGWKDWHVLTALANARVNQRNAGLSIAEMRRPGQGRQDETADETPLGAEWLTLERLDQMRQMSMLSEAKFWGLQLHQTTPDMDAFEWVMANRYGYWTDDVSHDPVFQTRSAAA